MAAKERPVLKKGAHVVARTALRDVPEGTKGRVMLVNGFAWIRYWVRWENGVYLGSVNRANLATPAEWARRHEDAAEEAAAAQEAEAAAAQAKDAAATPAAAGASGTASRIPAHLLERSKAAKARKAG